MAYSIFQLRKQIQEVVGKIAKRDKISTVTTSTDRIENLKIKEEKKNVENELILGSESLQ